MLEDGEKHRVLWGYFGVKGVEAIVDFGDGRTLGLVVGEGLGEVPCGDCVLICFRCCSGGGGELGCVIQEGRVVDSEGCGYGMGFDFLDEDGYELGVGVALGIDVVLYFGAPLDVLFDMLLGGVMFVCESAEGDSIFASVVR